jgi:hypothetical protein
MQLKLFNDMNGNVITNIDQMKEQFNDIQKMLPDLLAFLCPYNPSIEVVECIL